MFKTALNKNIIPHTWRLANIVPIPKPNKDTDEGTSYRPISLHSVIAKTLEKSRLPYITANIPNTPMQHGYERQHSTVTALHTLNNTVAKWFNQMASPARTITVALDMSKAFDTINIPRPFYIEKTTPMLYMAAIFIYFVDILFAIGINNCFILDILEYYLLHILEFYLLHILEFIGTNIYVI